VLSEKIPKVFKFVLLVFAQALLGLYSPFLREQEKAVETYKKAGVNLW